METSAKYDPDDSDTGQEQGALPQDAGSLATASAKRLFTRRVARWYWWGFCFWSVFYLLSLYGCDKGLTAAVLSDDDIANGDSSFRQEPW